MKQQITSLKLTLLFLECIKEFLLNVHNLFHNILELFKILEQVLFPTSKTISSIKCSLYYLPQKRRTIHKKFLVSLLLVSLPGKKTLAVGVKNYTKADIKVFWSVQFFLIPAQKMKFSFKSFFSKCDQCGSFLWIWSHLLKKFLIENLIFCAVWLTVED